MNYYVAGVPYSPNQLYHFGIKGQKWGIRRYQNPDGTLTPEGKARYGTKENFDNSIAYRVAKGDYYWDKNPYTKSAYDTARKAYAKSLKDAMNLDLDQLEKESDRRETIKVGALMASIIIAGGSIAFGISKMK